MHVHGLLFFIGYVYFMADDKRFWDDPLDRDKT